MYLDSDITNTTPDGCEEEGVPCAIEWNELPPPPPPPPSGDCPIHLRSMQKQVNQGLFELVEDELLCPQQDWAYAVLAGTAIAEQNWLTAQSAVDFISLDNNRSVAMKQYFQTLIDGQKESAGKTDFRLAELQDASKASKKTFERSLAQSTIAILKGKSFNRRIKRPTMNKQETILESFHRLINIFPNPTAQPIINIDLQAHDINTESTLVIKSITGRFVKSISLNKDTKQYEIDVSNIQNGLYLIFLEDGNKNIAASGKLVISK